MAALIGLHNHTPRRLSVEEIPIETTEAFLEKGLKCICDLNEKKEEIAVACKNLLSVSEKTYSLTVVCKGD